MSLELFKMHGKAAWITGGTKGLGLQMANALGGAGANIFITSRHRQECELVAKAIAQKHNVRALGVEADVTNENQINEAVRRAEAELGGIDILINNAGINIRKPTTEMPLADWQQVIDINLTGPFICSKAVAPGMIRKNWGRIIYMSSMLGQVGLAARPPYTASKAALILLAKTQALEFAKNGITVNAICPGYIGTEMVRAIPEDVLAKRILPLIPVGRLGEPEEIARCVAFLAADDASFITGSTLSANGGQLMT